MGNITTIYKGITMETIENLLLAIQIENLYSIRDRLTIDFRAANIKTQRAKLLSDNIFEWNGQKILKTIGLFGPNAAGKSNIIQAIRFCCMMILESHQNNENSIFAFAPFRFQGYQSKPSFFRILFVSEGIEYEYAYSFTRTEILEESLYYYPLGRKVKIFTRKGNSYSFGTTKVFHQPKIITEYTSSKTLFLSRASSMKQPLAQQLFRFFNEHFMLGIAPIQEVYKQTFLNQYKHLVLRLLQLCDSDICDIRSQTIKTGTTVQISVDDKPTAAPQQLEMTRIFTYHMEDPNVPFAIEEESAGTLQILGLIPRLIGVHAANKALILDEFDTMLHVRMTEFVLNYIRASESSQFLFSSHNTSLINMEHFRRDQILFVEKDNTGNTIIKPLYNFKSFRENMDASKGYVNGHFGAIPNIENSVPVLKQLLKNPDLCVSE